MSVVRLVQFTDTHLQADAASTMRGTNTLETLRRTLSAARETIAAAERNGAPLPSLHSAKFAPVPEPAIKTGVTALAATAFDLLGK